MSIAPKFDITKSNWPKTLVGTAMAVLDGVVVAEELLEVADGEVLVVLDAAEEEEDGVEE